MSSVSPQVVPFALNVIVPALDTSPDNVRSPVPRFCQVVPDETVAVLVVKLDEFVEIP
jgi:hypothetical protein